jgi:hypothetical protein
MEKGTTTQPNLGTWDRLPTEEKERAPRLQFEVNIPSEVTFVSESPREFTGETGVYYIFDVTVGTENKVIITSAWTLLRALKVLTPLKDKKVRITKRLVKGKQNFEVTQI